MQRFLSTAEFETSLSESEQQAVQRLQGLGFDRAQAIEAYLICDKNEELAANWLFDHGFE